MEYSELYVKRIRTLCKERGIAINKLATMSDVKQSTLDNIVRGLTKNPRAKTLHKIALAFNMTLAEFLDFKELNEYSFEDDVEVYSLPRCYKYEPLGFGKLTHDPVQGFVLTGHYREQDYRIQRTPLQTNSLHVEYDFLRIKPFDLVDISTENDSVYCYTTKKDVITKLAFATEEIYKIELEKKRGLR